MHQFRHQELPNSGCRKPRVVWFAVYYKGRFSNFLYIGTSGIPNYCCFPTALRQLIIHIATGSNSTMRVFTALSSILLLAGISPAASQTTASPTASSTAISGPVATSACQCTQNDTSVVEFAWALQNLTSQFFATTGADATLLSSAPNDSIAEWLPNFRGMNRRSQLGLLAIRREAPKCPLFVAPKCNYSIPIPSDSTALLQLTFQLETSVSGAMIGLVAHTLSPEISFLLARLAATHAAQAAFIESQLTEPVFQNATNATLAPAFPPAVVLSRGNRPGMLGNWLSDCVSAPPQPCGQTLLVSRVSGNLTSNSSVISSVFATATASL